jgi:ABC-type multidrug transport system fused ATPase/permease subunit
VSPFWYFTKKMLRRRSTVAWALVFALITAGGLGAGLLSLGPMLRLILQDETSLPTLAEQFNDQGHWLTIPAPAIAWLPQGRFEGVVLIVVAISVITIIGGAAGFMHKYLSQFLAARMVAQIRQEAFHHVVHLPLSRVITRGPSEFVARIVRDAAELQRGFIALTSKAVTHLLKGLAAFIAALVFQWQLTLTAVVVAPVLLVILRKLGKRIRRGTRGSLQAQESLLRIATETMHGLRAVKANTGERQATSWFHRVNKVVLQQELRVRTARALTAPAMEILAIAVMGGLAILAARLIIAGSLSFQQFILALGSLGIAGASFKPLASLINELQAASAPAGRLAEILNVPREGSDGVRLKSVPRHQVSIRFEAVTARDHAGRAAGGGRSQRVRQDDAGEPAAAAAGAAVGPRPDRRHGPGDGEPPQHPPPDRRGHPGDGPVSGHDRREHRLRHQRVGRGFPPADSRCRPARTRR